MDEERRPKDGGRVGPKEGGRVGPKPPRDVTTSQTPSQSGIPAWMVARNNSVHAPTFGQPSIREGTSRKSSRMLPPPVPPARSARPISPEIKAAIQARNVTTEPRACPPPPQPSTSLHPDALDDDQALALLQKNETVARLLQNAFNTRVEEYQQKLHQAYDQRLLELEEYTRRWREATKELWSALSEGKLEPTDDQREFLLWKGPQDSARGFIPELSAAPKEVVQKEYDSDGRVACISVKASKQALHITQPPRGHEPNVPIILD